MLCLFLGSAVAMEAYTGRESMGGGAIKLFAAVSGALGIILALEAAGVFIVSTAVASVPGKHLFDLDRLPSSPFILFSVVCVYALNYC